MFNNNTEGQTNKTYLIYIAEVIADIDRDSDCKYSKCLKQCRGKIHIMYNIIDHYLLNY